MSFTTGLIVWAVCVTIHAVIYLAIWAGNGYRWR